jgi:hypothetical protein
MTQRDAQMTNAGIDDSHLMASLLQLSYTSHWEFYAGTNLVLVVQYYIDAIKYIMTCDTYLHCLH